MIAVVLNPVDATALTSDPPIAPAVGLPADALTCATCGGRGGWDVAPLTWADSSRWHKCEACEACEAGRVVVPEGRFPALIATTAAEPDMTRDQWDAFGAAGFVDEAGVSLAIHRASVLGTATLELLPVTGYDDGCKVGPHFALDEYGGDRLLIACNGRDDGTEDTDMAAALPFGSWVPGGYGLRLIDFTASIECPTCGGRGRQWAGCGCGPGVSHVVDCGRRAPLCESCRGTRVLACPLSWGAAPDRPCITQLDVETLVSE